jgi:predicted nucleotidyltransferase
VRREYPRLAGILVHGSVARGEPGPFSDIDLVGVTNRKRKPSEFSYFDEDIYVGVGFLSIAELKKEFSDPKEFFWARGSAKTTRILYDPRGLLRSIMLHWKKAEPSYQILEKSLWDDYHNIIEYSGKLRNGWLKHDEYLTRYSARVIAQHVQRAIIALNDLSIISENYVWHQVPHARKKPRHLRTDYPLALGIKGTPDTQAVYRSAMRLCKETLGVIRVEFGGKAKRPRFRMLLGEPLEKHGL